VSRPPLGVHLRGPSVWIVWQTARDSLLARIGQLERDPGVHRDVVRQLRGTAADLEMAALEYRDWEQSHSAADSAEVESVGSGAGLENLPNRWGDTGLVAAELGCSERWVRALCSSGRLAATRRGREWRIDLDSVMNFKRRGVNAA
jgi:excisionase family DNA binding protein